MEDKEIWKDIKGYEGLYQVSSYGRVKSLDRYVINNGKNQLIKGRLLKQNMNTWGYLGIILYKNGICNRYQIHRLVALTFIDNNDNKKEVNHIDGNKLNNHVSNLEWCTRSENMKHSFVMGLEKPPRLSGKDNPRSKAIEQYDLNDNYIRYFESANIAGKYLRNSNNIKGNSETIAKNISKCCIGIRQTAYGYKWGFKSE